MANKVYNMEGGLHSAAAYSAFEDALYGSCVASESDYVCTAGTGMTVQLTAGQGLISTGTGYARRIGSDSANTITVSAASTANPRIDAIVAYIDNSVTPTTSVVDNTNDILKFKAVAGSPAASPVAPSAATIQSSVGAGNPYMVLWTVRVPANATSLATATFTDVRTFAKVEIGDGSITTNKLANGAVTPAKIDYSSMGAVWSSFYFSGVSLADQTVNVTTKKGTALTLRVAAGGTAVRIISGASGINAIRQFWSAKLNGVADEYGISGLKSAWTIYTRFYGSMGNTAIGGGEVASTSSSGTDGMCDANLGTVSNAARTSSTAEFLLLRESTDVEGWTIYGKIGSGGILADASFGAKIQSAAGYAPTVYQRSATSSNTSYVFNCIEVLES